MVEREVSTLDTRVRFPPPAFLHTMSALVEIRTARPPDAETLLAIQREASVSGFAHIYPPERYPYPTEEVRALWQETLADPGVDAFVAEVERRAVGTVTVDAEFLRQLYVLPAHWSGGIGSALLDRGLARMRERGASRAKLWTLEGNERGRRFYERRGWTLTDETRVVPYPPNPIDVQYAIEL
jgi:GNAT superfamily N-acetyltransferase